MVFIKTFLHIEAVCIVAIVWIMYISSSDVQSENSQCDPSVWHPTTPPGTINIRVTLMNICKA
jgi:hypothetical protein